MPNDFLNQIQQIDAFLEQRQQAQQATGVNPQRQAARDDIDLQTADAARSLIASSQEPVSTLSDESLFPGAAARAEATPKTTPIRGFGGSILGQRANEDFVLAKMLGSVKAPASVDEIRQRQEQRLLQGVETARGLLDRIVPENRQEEQTFLRLAEVAGSIEKESVKAIGERDPTRMAKDLLELQKLKLGISKEAAGIDKLKAETDKINAEGKAKKEETGPAAAKLKKELADMELATGELEDISKDFDVDAFTLGGKLAEGIAIAADYAGVSTESQQKLIESRTIQYQKIEQFFNAYRKLITGAQASVKEIEQLRKTILNAKSSPSQVRAALKSVLIAYKLDIATKSLLLQQGITPEGDDDPFYNLKWQKIRSQLRSNLQDSITRDIEKKYPKLNVPKAEINRNKSEDSDIKSYVQANADKIRAAQEARQKRQQNAGRFD